MANYKRWTEAELKFINENQKLLSDDELAAKLSQMTTQNITTSMIRRQRRKLGIKKAKGRRPKIRIIESPEENSTQTV
jgi:hypothetical protein